MIAEKRFKVGDTLTYKSREDCVNSVGRPGYYCKGENRAGKKGQIVEYRGYVPEKKCWKMVVTCKNDLDYFMLECEFEEYIQPELTISEKVSKRLQNVPIAVYPMSGTNHPQI